MPYKRDYILQKRPIISSILLTVATPYATSELITEYTTEISIEEFSKRHLVTKSTTNFTMENDYAEILQSQLVAKSTSEMTMENENATSQLVTKSLLLYECKQRHTAPHCNTLHHTTPHYTTLHHTATHCITPQHTQLHE